MVSTATEAAEGHTGSSSFVRPRDGWDGRHWAAAGLAAVTGVIHLYVGVLADPGFAPVFYLAGIGWFVGVAAFFTTFWRRWMYLLGAGYAVLQILLWVASGFQFFALGVVDKVVELAYLALVLVLYRSDR